MGLYFGTDGIRGVANREITPDLAFRCGNALAAEYRRLFSGIIQSYTFK